MCHVGRLVRGTWSLVHQSGKAAVATQSMQAWTRPEAEKRSRWKDDGAFIRLRMEHFCIEECSCVVCTSRLHTCSSSECSPMPKGAWMLAMHSMQTCGDAPENALVVNSPAGFSSKHLLQVLRAGGRGG